ncbi:MAG: glycosyltransferase family 4 protein [Gammaproteobacteria bacterium]
MKILVIAAGPFPLARGTPARTLRVSEALEARGHEVCVAAFPLADDSIETTLRIERSPGVRSYNKTSPGPSIKKFFLMNPRLATTVRELLERERFDAIYAHHYEGLLVASVARRRSRLRIPIIFDSHTLLGSELSFYAPGIFGWPADRFGAILDKCLFRLADAVIGVTDEIAYFYASRSESDMPILSAVNGVECEKFAHPPRSDVGRKPILVVFAGNLSSYQGFDLLVSAFGRIRKQRNDIELLVASEDAIDALSAVGIDDPFEHGILVQPGGFTELPQVLAAADIAVNPRTVCPGIPQKLLNYMAAELPTVSFDGSAAILVHEESGLIVPNGDTDKFAEAVIRLADSPELRMRLGHTALNLVRSEFTWDRVAVTFERIAGVLLGSPSANTA